MNPLHTVIETEAYLHAAKAAGMSPDERDDIVTLLAMKPEVGDEIPGTGGFRKLRYTKPGGGKRGGYRIITFFTGPDLPVVLISVFGKGERSDLSQAERNGLRAAKPGLVRSLEKLTKRSDQ